MPQKKRVRKKAGKKTLRKRALKKLRGGFDTEMVVAPRPTTTTKFSSGG